MLSAEIPKKVSSVTVFSEFEQNLMCLLHILWTLAFVVWVGFSVVSNNPWPAEMIGLSSIVGLFALAGGIIYILLRIIFGLHNRLLFMVLVTGAPVIRLFNVYFGNLGSILVYMLMTICVFSAVSLIVRTTLNSQKVGITRALLFLFCIFMLAVVYVRTIQAPPLNKAIYEQQMTDKTLNQPNPASPGSYSVEVFTYGSGKDKHRPEYAADADYITQSVDGSLLLDNWNGYRKVIRNLYWGIDANTLPVQGRVWWPRNKENSPLIVMLHGNNQMESYSDDGYEYLGTLLASKGYTFVAVDHNFLNGTLAEGFFNVAWRLRGETDARGWLALKHLQQWQKWRAEGKMEAAKQVDLENILFVGHSRGGEAALIASEFNKLSYYPENSAQDFDFGFGIKGVVAIAPSTDQYEPRNSRLNIKDISFLTLQGDVDGDATIFMGNTHYYRTSLSKNSLQFKSSILIGGANHGQFNSSWGRCDSIQYHCAFGLFEHLIMPESQQQEIAKVFIAAFADVVLNEQRDLLPIFQDASYAAKWLPETYFNNNFLSSKDYVLADYEEDFDISTGKAAELKAVYFDDWHEQRVILNSRWPWAGTENHAVELAWSNDAKRPTYSLTFNARDLTEKCIGFSVANLESGEDGTLTFSVETVDQSGVRAMIALNGKRAIAPVTGKKPFNDHLFKNVISYEPHFQSVRISMAEFKRANQNLKLTHIKQMNLIMNSSTEGRAYFDDFVVSSCF